MVPSNDLLALAGTIAGEIRGGTREQMENVAQVVLNRHNSGNRPTVRSVCLVPKQFSCWNPNDVNRSQITNIDVTEPDIWAICLDVAHKALIGQNPDRVGGAKNYFATASKDPWWLVGRYLITLRDGAHTFVRFL